MRQSVRIQNFEPLLLASFRGISFNVDTLDYIPGTALRGAVAAAYLLAGGNTGSAAFRTVFQCDSGANWVRFTDLRLTGASPWPRSVSLCSLYGTRHEICDGLRPASGIQIMREKCPQSDCGEKLETPNGMFRLNESRRPEKVAPTIERRAHTAIDPRHLRVAPNQFFTHTVLAREQTFHGSLVGIGPDGESALSDVLEKLGAKPDEPIGLSLGAGRTRGMGGALAYFSPQQTVDDLAARLREFNGKQLAEGRVGLSCDFRSKTVIFDPWLRSKLHVQGSDLHLDLSEYHAVSWYSAPEVAAGWHGQAQLPREPLATMAAGSCFYFERQLPPGLSSESEIARLVPILAQLEEHGCGERLTEGFGEARFCAQEIRR